MMMCSRCKKRPAVVFISSMQGTERRNEGLCLRCAKEMGLPQVDEYLKQMGISEEDFENAYDSMFDENGNPDPELLKQHLTDAARAALKAYAAEVETIEWKREALSAMMKGLLKQNKMKMPQVAMPLRLLLTGQLHTPSIDAVVCLFGRETVLSRLKGL